MQKPYKPRSPYLDQRVLIQIKIIEILSLTLRAAIAHSVTKVIHKGSMGYWEVRFWGLGLPWMVSGLGQPE